jgi:uncharacterized membrane protein
MNSSIKSGKSAKAGKSGKGLVLGGVLAGLLLVGAGGVAFAGQFGGHGGGGPHGWGGPMALMQLVNRLDLSDQQELQLIKIRKSMHQEGKQARQEMQANISQIADELEKPAPNASKIHGVADQAMQRFSKVVHGAIDQFLTLHATLTPDQRETLVQSIREHQAQRMERLDQVEKKSKVQ